MASDLGTRAVLAPTMLLLVGGIYWLDLSGSLGMPGRFDAPAVKEALAQVEDAASKHGWLAGFHVVPTAFDDVEQKLERGYRLIAHSLDTLWLGEGARDSVAIRAARKASATVSPVRSRRDDSLSGCRRYAASGSGSYQKRSVRAMRSHISQSSA